MDDKRCPYYEERPVRCCNAILSGIKVPTDREVEWFCLGGHYQDCPTYISREKGVNESYKTSKV